MKISTAFALTLPAAVVAAAPAPAQNASKMQAVVAHMEAVKTMTANFTQTDRRGRSVAGKLYMKRPGHVRFQYQKGVPLLIVGNGSSLTMIDYEVNQVQRWPIKNSPLTALVDPGKDLARYGRVMPTSNPNVISVAVKDPKRPEYGTITMIFIKKASAPTGWELDRWVALDSKNNRTTVRLSNVKYGMPISSSRFKWKDPRPRKRR